MSSSPAHLISGKRETNQMGGVQGRPSSDGEGGEREADTSRLQFSVGDPQDTESTAEKRYEVCSERAAS